MTSSESRLSSGNLMPSNVKLPLEFTSAGLVITFFIITLEISFGQ